MLKFKNKFGSLRVKCVYLSLPKNYFLVHISLLFLFFLLLPNTPHSSSIITAAAICFDELILDTETYEQSLGIHSCVCGEIYPSLAPESSSPEADLRARLVRVWEPLDFGRRLLCVVCWSLNLNCPHRLHRDTASLPTLLKF